MIPLPLPAASTFSFFAAFLLSLGFVPLVIRLANRIGWLDRPGGIKAHKAPTPYGGGVAIAASTVIGTLCASLAGPEPDGATPVVLAAAALIFAGGIVDDLRPLGAWSKFAIQGAAAAALIAWDVRLHIRILPEALNVALTVFWIVGVTNAVNMIDILDGLAGAVTGVAAFTFGLIGLLCGEHELAIPAFALCGGICGFLRFNFQPARIFMGDAGAQFIGFLLAAVAIQGSYTTFNNIALLAPVLILGVPIFDTALISILRIRRGRSPFQASNDHLALRLRRMGLDVRGTVRACVLATAALSAAATAATLVTLLPAIFIYSVTLVASCALAWKVSSFEMDA